MSDEFSVIRTKAMHKRDAAIAKAKLEYRQRLKQIAAIQKTIISDSPRKNRTMEDGSTLRETMVAVLGDRKIWTVVHQPFNQTTLKSN